ncbi:hypothetical protein OTB20_32015 [Streptomyces sp. H27-H1]|uniref:hypothetical protein n=1 Tax=Streptomyces sp. H27-H1 TaxID=2996461 RepID=UPI00226DDFCA|nr:hypothetical protein [Streptomyces sp. H27-H1]MCY0930739.1 hypothetical protein [Streptomyces sp. H27-H1]
MDADTSTRGLILWYGTALAGADTGARELRTRAAVACLAAMDTELGLLPWGSAFGGPRLLARVDGLPGTVPLLAAAGLRGEAAAAAHLHRHLTLCLPHSYRPGPTGRRRAGGLARSRRPAGAADRLGCCSRWPTYCTGPPSLLKLARLPGPGAARYAHRAAEILQCLVDAHLVGGRLLDGCYDADKGIAVRHELVWGDFFLALRLAELTGLADVRTI